MFIDYLNLLNIWEIIPNINHKKKLKLYGQNLVRPHSYNSLYGNSDIKFSKVKPMKTKPEMTLLYIQFLKLATPWFACLKKLVNQSHSISGRHAGANQTRMTERIEVTWLEINSFPIVIRLTRNNCITVRGVCMQLHTYEVNFTENRYHYKQVVWDLPEFLARTINTN